jgi:hypothetical protein
MGGLQVKALVVSFAAWLVGLGVAELICHYSRVHAWWLGFILGLLLPIGFFLAALSWMEDK